MRTPAWWIKVETLEAFLKKSLPSINGDDTNLGFDRHQRVTLKGSENAKKLKSVTITDACVNSLNRCFLLNEKPLIY